MREQTLTDDLARGIDRVVHAKIYARIVAGKQHVGYDATA